MLALEMTQSVGRRSTFLHTGTSGGKQGHGRGKNPVLQVSPRAPVTSESITVKKKSFLLYNSPFRHLSYKNGRDVGKDLYMRMFI